MPYQQYLKLAKQRTSNLSEEEDDAILDKMDPLWYQMTELERQAVNKATIERNRKEDESV